MVLNAKKKLYKKYRKEKSAPIVMNTQHTL